MYIEKNNNIYSYFSRYQEDRIYYDVNDKKYIGLRPLWLDDTTPYITYTVNRGDTYDSIALNFYNNPTYWWVITDFNRIISPLNNLAAGTILMIPIFSNLIFEGLEPQNG